MGNELPNIWWLFTPEFVSYCGDKVLQNKDATSYNVLSYFLDHLKMSGHTYHDPTASCNMQGSDKWSGDYQDYQSMLLRMVALAPLGVRSPVHIVIEIPQDAATLTYMQIILDITKGISTFIKPYITFIGFNLDTVTIEIP